MDPISVGLNIGGGLLKAGAGAAAERKRNGLLASGIREQGRAGIEAGNAVNSAVDFIGASRPDVLGSQEQFAAALRGGPQVSGLPTASRAFNMGAADANAGNAASGNQMAEWAAQLRAPQDQRRVEGRQFRRMGGQLQDIQRDAESKDFINQLRVGQVKTNPWLTMAGDVMQNAGRSGLFARGPAATTADLAQLEIAPNARTVLPVGWQ